LGPTAWFLLEDEDRIQSPKSCVLKYKEDGVLDENRAMNNLEKQYFY
jgi:hypothetical protein